MGTLAAFSDNNPSQAAGGYANATAGMWQQTIEKPWCAMEFGNVGWCMSPLDGQTRAWRADVEAHLSDAEAPNPNPAAQQQLERQRLQDAQTNGELWLAFPANDDARNGATDSWTLYHHLQQARPELAQIRGSRGVGQRLWNLVLTGIGMFFFVLLLTYIALNLLIASIFFIVLLALTPFMALVAAFGEKGRGAFLRWLGWAGGALAAKLIYALYLGILLLAASVIDGIGEQTGGWLNEWILFAALWALAFMYRGKLLGLFTADTHHEHHRGLEAATVGLGALALTRAVGSRAVAQPTRRAVARGQDRRQERRYLNDVRTDEERHRTVIEEQRALGQNAEQQLTGRARSMLDAHYERARETLTRRPELTEQVAVARAEADQLRTKRLAHGGAPSAGAQELAARGRAAAFEGELLSAERFMHEVHEHERLTGQRYTPRQLQDARHGLEQELGTHPEHRDYEQLAYRLDGGRDTWRRASEPERQQLRGEIDRQIDADRTVLATARRTPAQLPPPRPTAPPPPRRHPPHRHGRRGEFVGSRRHMPPGPRRRS
jgi:hypothetical protein